MKRKKGKLMNKEKDKPAIQGTVVLHIIDKMSFEVIDIVKFTVTNYLL